ncbi:hypothetical protein SKAU_G00011980 [Synaphobranchus kaupii]|uniref:Ig-like domain-containing protein n=1 Tax=Synaphobranchus kaupii TaxID=118154 RepID=A0A9Q1GA57_SYNKA|nr:hypothetical protein SKAU_G00011980 [Synaphobranchus kaupii]
MRDSVVRFPSAGVKSHDPKLLIPCPGRLSPLIAQSSRMLLSFLTIQFIAMGVEAEPFATLAPPFHLSRESGSRTILVCLVSHHTRGDMVVTWLSSRAGESSHITHSVAREEDGTHSAVSVISVATDEWDSYTCFITHSNPVTVIQRRYIDFLDEELHGSCYADVPNAIQIQSDAMFILVLRILLLKLTIFNFLMTTNAVIKWITAVPHVAYLQTDSPSTLYEQNKKKRSRKVTPPRRMPAR